MMKKVFTGALLLGLVLFLIIGGVIRTQEKMAQAALAAAWADTNHDPVTAQTSQADASENISDGWITLQGTLLESTDAGGDPRLLTQDGSILSLGTGPGYMQSQGFALAPGEPVQVRGYWEDGEFRAAIITRMTDGASLTLRDQTGRPAWAGQGLRRGAFQSRQ